MKRGIPEGLLRAAVCTAVLTAILFTGSAFAGDEGSRNTLTNNFVAFGGGNPIGNAATQIDLFTGSTTTTQTGFSRMTVKGNRYIGFGTQSPAHPLHMASGAHVTTGGVWTNASSREYKENISRLSADKALNALKALDPVEFTYKADKEERHTGFIAEDAPEFVATKDRKGLSPMDIVAVLTKVVQEQEKKIEEQHSKIAGIEADNKALRIELNERLALIEKQLKLKGTIASAETGY